MKSIRNLVGNTISFDSDLVKGNYKVIRVEGDNLVVKSDTGIISHMSGEYVERILSNGEAEID